MSEQTRIGQEIARITGSSDPFAAAVRATRMPMLITDPDQPDNPIVFVNDAFSALTLYTRAEILGRNCRFLQGPETDRRGVARVRDAILNRVPLEIDLLNYKKSGENFGTGSWFRPCSTKRASSPISLRLKYDVTIEKERPVLLQRDRDQLESEVQQRMRDIRQSEQRFQFVLKAAA